MPGWAVIPTIRVPDMTEGLRFYQDVLGFALDRGDVNQPNNSLTRGDARVMLETLPTSSARVTTRRSGIASTESRP